MLILQMGLMLLLIVTVGLNQGHHAGRMGFGESSLLAHGEGGLLPEEWMALLLFCITCIRAPTSPSEL